MNINSDISFTLCHIWHVGPRRLAKSNTKICRQGRAQGAETTAHGAETTAHGAETTAHGAETTASRYSHLLSLHTDVSLICRYFFVVQKMYCTSVIKRIYHYARCDR